MCVHSKSLVKLPVAQNYKAPMKDQTFSEKQFSRILLNEE